MRQQVLHKALMVWMVATLACSDTESDDEGPRAAVLERSPAQIAADGLGAAPTPEFAAARGRIAGRVGKQRRSYVRDFVIVGGRGPVLARDLELTGVRASAASALGTALDPVKEQDEALAQEALDVLVREMQRLVPSATRCADLGAKADDCVTTLIIIEVKRSERTSAPSLIDASMAPATAAPSDAGVPDALPPESATAQLGCGDRSIVGARVVEASFDKDQTWSGTILIRGSVRVNGGRLTIAPGTRVLFEPGSELDVGFNGTKPTLIADGAAAPISFCGLREDPGSWLRLRIRNSVTGDSVLRNVLVANGGRDEAALQVDADILIDNVQVQRSGQDGVWASDFKPGSRGLSVSGSGKLAVVLTAPAAASDFPLGGTFKMNGRDVVALRFTSLDRDTTLHALGVPYVQEETVRQTQGSLRIEAGVELRMAARSALLLGFNGGTTEIHAEGRADAPIVLRGDEEGPAHWDQLKVYASVRTSSSLRHVEVRHAGSAGAAALQILSAITLDHVTLRQNALGALIESSGLAPTSRDLTITETNDRPLTVSIDALTTLPSGGNLSGNRVDEIFVRSGDHDRSGVIRDLGVPYVIDGQFNVTGGELTVEPGVQFVFARGGLFSVGRNDTMPRVVLRGAADKPIQFRGAMAVPGSWTGLRFYASARMDSVLDQLTVAHAGGPGGAAIEVQPAIAVTNTRISDSAGFGIEHKSTAIDYSVSNTFTNVAQGATNPL